MRISDWSSDVCSSDLHLAENTAHDAANQEPLHNQQRHRRHHAHAERETRDLSRHAQRKGGEQEDEQGDRKSGVTGKSVAVRVDLGGRRIIKKKNKLYM